MIKLLKTALLLLTCMVSTAGYSAVTEDRLAAIIKAENNGRMLEALSQARSHYHKNQDDVMAQLTYGRLLVKNGKATAAIDVLKPLASKHSDDWRPWFWLGSAQLMEEQLDVAAWSMDEALAREGGNVSLWVQRAVVEQELGNFQMAANMLQVADSIEPQHPDVLVNYAYALEQLGDTDKAIAVYRNFLIVSVSNNQAGRMRSHVVTRLAQIEQARRQPQGDAEARNSTTAQAEHIETAEKSERNIVTSEGFSRDH